MKLMHTIVDEQELLHALGGLGMDAEAVRRFIQSIRLKQWENGKWILTSHRSKLLSDVHETQERLYNMDFLIRALKTNKELYNIGDAKGENR